MTRSGSSIQYSFFCSYSQLVHVFNRVFAFCFKAKKLAAKEEEVKPVKKEEVQEGNWIFLFYIYFK